MGLEDLTPDDSNTSSRSSTNRTNSQPDEDEYHKVIGNPPHQKCFTEERWEEVKQEIHNNFEKTVNEILNSPAKKRYEMLHEAAMASGGELDDDEREFEAKTRCAFCGKSCPSGGVEIDGEVFHTSHTAAQVADELYD